jgi:hypothetical protein
MIGHATELYLKAAHAKLTNNISGTVKKAHCLNDLWNECKQCDDNFMPEYELKDAVIDADLMGGHGYGHLSVEDQKHFGINAELYYVCKYLPDLKYLGGPLKRVTGSFAWGAVSFNPYWIKFFKSFRKYLEYDNVQLHDSIHAFIDNNNGSRPAVYLSGFSFFVFLFGSLSSIF